MKVINQNEVQLETDDERAAQHRFEELLSGGLSIYEAVDRLRARWPKVDQTFWAWLRDEDLTGAGLPGPVERAVRIMSSAAEFAREAALVGPTELNAGNLAAALTAAMTELVEWVQPRTRRTFLVHLNVSTDKNDRRSSDEIAELVMGAIEVGSDDNTVAGLEIVCPLAEEIG